jgi:hypothetical protein
MLEFIIILVLCGLPVLGEILSKCCKCYCFGRCVMKIAWFISGIFSIIIFIYVIIMYLIIMVANDGCKLLDNVLKD